MGRRNIEINPIRGERVKELIKDSGMTQSDFAKEVLNCSINHLSYMVKGHRTVSEQTIDIVYDWAISRGIDVRKEWLLCLDDIKTEKEWFTISSQHSIDRYRAVNTLIESHGYRLSEYIYPKVLTDEEGREYQQTFVVLTAPNGYIHYFKPEEYRAFQNNINNIVEGLLLLECKPPIGDALKEYIKQK